MQALSKIIVLMGPPYKDIEGLTFIVKGVKLIDNTQKDTYRLSS